MIRNQDDYLSSGDIAELDTTLDPATETTLQAIAGMVDVEYDSATVTYTDTTKEFINTIVFKNGVTTVRTITVTYPNTTTEIYTKS